MFRSNFVRSFAVVAGAFVLASCSETGITTPGGSSDAFTAPTGAHFKADAPGGADPAHLKLRAIEWKNGHQNKFRVSQVIDQSGGTISIPETGFTMVFPAGAVSEPIKITVSSDHKYVAYKMKPSGTRFLQDVVVTQLLSFTELAGAPLRNQLFAAYIADDRLDLRREIKALEIERSWTIFSATGAPEAHVWIIRHFSRYMLASG